MKRTRFPPSDSKGKSNNIVVLKSVISIVDYLYFRVKYFFKVYFVINSTGKQYRFVSFYL